MTVWFDIEDLARHFRRSPRPTGIQRLSFEIYRALSRLPASGTPIHFCRYDPDAAAFAAADFFILEAAILAAAAAPAAPRAMPSAATNGRRLRQPGAPAWQPALADIAAGMAQAARGALRLGRAGLRQARTTMRRRRRAENAGIELAAGDWLVNLGANWDRPYDPAVLARLKAARVRLALLIYDLVPELFPEWAAQITVTQYRAWLRGSVAAADLVFAISRNTASDLTSCLAAAGQPAPRQLVLPIGHTLPAAAGAEQPPLPRPYVLLVATIEARKNHPLMLRLWRRLLRELPHDQVPDLVFAGKIGWLTGDFLQQLDNAAWLGGRIKFLAGPSEPELAALYRHCLFTVFPSFYEGWGLPVTESLGFGKPVAASNTSSIPEAGGDYCRYFDPDNLTEAYAVVAEMIRQPQALAALQARIAAEFDPPGWADTAAAVMRALA